MKRRLFLGICLIPFLPLLLISCPSPIVQEMLNHVNDVLPPIITIVSPEEGSYCANTVVVNGTVTDRSTEADDAGKISAFTYEVLSSTVVGEVAINDDGTFSFDFSTADLGSNFVLKLTAEDWNGNTGVISRTLLKLDGNDIPSFSAEPGNKSITLTWDDVPHTSFKLYIILHNGGINAV